MNETKMNITLLIGAFLGLTSVMMAAYVDHSLNLHLNSQVLGSVLTAVRYHQLYAIVICAIGFSIPLQSNQRIKSWLMRSAYIFAAGAILFSAGIYFATILSMAGIIYLTPVGGVLLMAGWGCLIRTALLRN